MTTQSKNLTRMETANLPPAAKAVIKNAVSTALLPLTLARSCGRQDAERSGFEASSFPGRVIADVDPDRILLKLDVLSLFVEDGAAAGLVTRLQPHLNRQGTQALVTATDTKEFSYLFGDSILEGDKDYDKESLVVFFQSETQDPLLWARGTNGRAYDVDTGTIIKRLESWRERCEFSLLGAGFDWVELRFETLPSDLKEFAEEVYDFCPDTIDQGIAVQDPQNHETLDETAFQAMETLDDWMDDPSEEDPIGDLAASLKRDRRLYLWWDSGTR